MNYLIGTFRDARADGYLTTATLERRDKEFVVTLQNLKKTEQSKYESLEEAFLIFTKLTRKIIIGLNTFEAIAKVLKK